MKFTREQQKAISLRNRNILVSAAAGSGKTAVLVERIIQRITDKKQPLDIDRLLVMTFTKAAADQMRERILQAIEEKRRENPFDRHLQKQSALVHNARITTIHGFCLDVIRNHFHEIDLDPDFRVGDEGECRLIKQDVLEAVLEAAYEEGESEFLLMTESLAAQKSDVALEGMIRKLHDFSMSYPKQEEWLLHCQEMYQTVGESGFEELFWVRDLVKSVKIQLDDLLERLRGLLAAANLKDGPYMYCDALRNDIATVEELCRADDFRTMQEGFRTLSFGVLGREKKGGNFVDPEKKEAVQEGRNKVKKLLQKLTDDYFQETPEEASALMRECAPNVLALTKVTLAFSKAYSEAKRDKKLVDFNDLEHLCLEILEKGKETTAKEYRDFFEEIYVDEYQDSNLVQETLLHRISRKKPQANNLFMVGDVKQSIYRFRLARPALFMEKYDTYTEEESDRQRVDLHYNFRSRKEVLEAVNEIFSYLMKKEYGNIAYDDAAALYYGADYPESDAGQNQAELLLLASDEEIPDRELEAKAIAKRINELMRTQRIWDKKERRLRPAKYSDIVILLRTNKGWDETFKHVIAAEGIPVHVASSTGYFSAMEIRTILEFLRVIDNPRQDIPLAASMRSPFGDFTDEELALVRSRTKAGSLYEALCGFEGEEQEDFVFLQKIEAFLEKLKYYREKSAYTPVYYLLLEMLESEYGSLVLAMSGGERRRANLNMLLKKAEDYGKTSYKGLFHFVRYIEFLQKYEVDFGEANLLDENDDTVRIMSIHKSKGLEFPICFVAGMSKRINYQDARAGVVLDVDYGIGMDRIDTKLRTRRPTLLKRAASQKLVQESLAEEMRIFYVALTRAEEKIIMTGIVKEPEKKLEEEPLLSKAASFLDFFVYAKQKAGELASVKIDCGGVMELTEQEIGEAISREAIREELTGLLRTGRQTEPTPFQRELCERLQFTYPYEERPDSFAKVSVSELKKRSMILRASEDQELAANEKLLYEEPPVVPYIPKFIQEDSSFEIPPAMHGTAFHRMLELWDYKSPADEKSVHAYFERVLAEKRMERELYEAVRVKEIAAFLGTDLAIRMGRASVNSGLYREQPFVIGIEERLIEPIADRGEAVLKAQVFPSGTDTDVDTFVLVQGIIDACFIEDEALVIVDYKTDKLKTPEALSDRYRAQLNYYAYALARLTGLPVKEKVIYSSYLNKVIQI
ncbi:MAG: helicase-exonuclease AddAB subunit AddA [Lachnospiraceae bacterium]